MRAKRVHCKINYPRKGQLRLHAPEARRRGPAQGWGPSLPHTHLLHLLLRVSTRPHSLEDLRTLSLAREGMQIAIQRRAGCPGNTASQSLTSPALAAALAQVRGLGAGVVSKPTMQSRPPAQGRCHGAAQQDCDLSPCGFAHSCTCVSLCARPCAYISTCCQEPHVASTNPCSQTRKVAPRGTWSLPPSPGGPAPRAMRQREKSKQVFCRPPAPLPTLQLRLPPATALTRHYGLL